MKKIRKAGITITNQAVLLKGVNDSAEEIEELMNALTGIGVTPYYLYQCMPVSKVRHHFQVPLKKGIDLVDKAKNNIDGYGKRFKFIIAHESGKIEICGRINQKVFLKRVHSSPEDHHEKTGMLVKNLINDNAGWLEDLQ